MEKGNPNVLPTRVPSFGVLTLPGQRLHQSARWSLEGLVLMFEPGEGQGGMTGRWCSALFARSPPVPPNATIAVEPPSVHVVSEIALRASSPGGSRSRPGWEGTHLETEPGPAFTVGGKMWRPASGPAPIF
jgi:hypothetical protein